MGRVVKVAQSSVAGLTEKTSDPAGGVVMIDRKAIGMPIFGRHPSLRTETDRAETLLGFE